MRKKRDLAAIAFFLFFSSALFAENPGDKTVTMAFQDQETGNLIIEIVEYHRNQFSPGPQAGLWLNFGDTAGLYWGNLKNGFYKLHKQAEGGTSSWTRYRGDITISAPVKGNLKRTAALKLRCNVEHGTSGEKIRSGTLELTCEGKSARFESSEEARAAIAEALVQNEVILNPLPNVRVIRFALKYPGQNKYLVIDESKLNFEHQTSEVVVWDDGKLSFETVVDEEKSRDTEHEYWEGPMYFTLQNGDIIYIPGVLHTEKSASLLPVEGPEIPLIEIRVENQRMHGKIRKQLALPMKRYKMPILRTPCELLVRRGGLPPGS